MGFADAPEHLLEQAARCTDIAHACDTLNRLLFPDATSPTEINLAADVSKLTELKVFLSNLEYLPKYDDAEITALLAGFHGDCGAACGIAMAEPHLLDLMLRHGYTIDEAARKDQEEQDKIRKDKAYEEQERRAREHEERFRQQARGRGQDTRGSSRHSQEGGLRMGCIPADACAIL